MKIFIVVENQTETSFLEQYNQLIDNTAKEKDYCSFLSQLQHLMQEAEIFFSSGNEDKPEDKDKDELIQALPSMNASKKLPIPSKLLPDSGKISGTELWVQLFMTSHYENAMKEMFSYLDSLKETHDKLEMKLLHFLIEFSYYIKLFISDNHLAIPYYTINEESGSHFAVCTHSIENMKSWLKELSKRLQPYRSQTEYSYTAVERVQQYIKKNLNNNITRAELASLVYLHPDYLSHIFRNQTGMSLQEYIMEERILRAKHLLLHTNLSISAIALECGYENAAYFSKTFKKLAGMTPKAFKSSEKNSAC